MDGMRNEAARQSVSLPLTGAGPWTGVGNALLGAGFVAWRTWGLARYGAKVFSAKLGGLIDIIRNPRVYPRFADGVHNNRVLEIKGPKDTLSGRQAGDARRCSGGQEPYVVGCKSCSVNCSGGCPKNLTQGPLP
jgi:hypothetical protein